MVLLDMLKYMEGLGGIIMTEIKYRSDINGNLSQVFIINHLINRAMKSGLFSPSVKAGDG